MGQSSTVEAGIVSLEAAARCRAAFAEIDPKAGDARFRPALESLLKLLPPADSYWPQSKRKRWLAAFAALADLVYGPTENAIEIRHDEPQR